MIKKLEEKVERLKAHLMERETILDGVSIEADELRDRLKSFGDDARHVAGLRETLMRKEEEVSNLETALDALTLQYKQQLQERQAMVRDSCASQAEARISRLSTQWAQTEKQLRESAAEWERKALVAQEKEDSWMRRAQMAEKETEPLKEALAATLEKMQAHVEREHYSVDRRVVSSLVTAFFDGSKSAASKAEVLRLLVNILRLNPEQKEIVEHGQSSSWWGSGAARASPEGENVGDAFVQFLLKESEG